jgi:hypothetical protein
VLAYDPFVPPRMFAFPFGVQSFPMPALNQATADALIAMEKHSLETREIEFPSGGKKLEIDLVSKDGNEKFLLDVVRGRIKISKVTFQNRARDTVVLVRLDIDGPPHTNPDGTFVPCPHLHVFRQGYDDKWAEPMPPAFFTNPSDPIHTFNEFMRYCNVTVFPVLKLRLPI